MTIVLDTNVLVSALINPFGTPAQVLNLVLAGEIALALDDRILAEYREVLGRERFGFDPRDVAVLIEFIGHEGVLASARPWSRPLPDPDDLPFVEVAAAANAMVVTGDTRHYPPSTVDPVIVGSPAEFLSEWLAANPPRG